MILTIPYTGAAIVRKTSPNFNQQYAEDGTMIAGSSTYPVRLLVRFGNISATYARKKLIKAYFSFTCYAGSTSSTAITWGDVTGLTDDIDTSTVTWNTTPPTSTRSAIAFFKKSRTELFVPNVDGSYLNDSGTTSETLTEPEISRASKRMIEFGSLAIIPWSGINVFADGAFTLYVEIDETIDINSQVKVTAGPRSEWANPAASQRFAWEMSYSGEYPSAGNFAQRSAVFHWKLSSASSYTDVSISGNTQEITIAPNTFPGGTIEWYVTATDDDGVTTNTPVYSFTTNDTLPTTFLVSPLQTIEDASAPIDFNWRVENDTGTLPTRADLQRSSDGATWETLGTVSGSGTTWSAPAGTFFGGTVFWRVRSYNRDGVAGEWSNPGSFVAFGSPPAPTVSVDAVPFAKVYWQSTGQQAYRVTIDGTLYGPFFGGAKSFETPDYLQNGTHLAAVEIQGNYGLWSSPGAVTFVIQNQQGDPISLTGTFDRDAILSWETQSNVSNFFIYRDGVQVGKTEYNTFTDRTILGEHSWQVINKLPNGNYSESNIVSGALNTCAISLALLSGGDWLELPKSANELRNIGSIKSQAVSLIQFAGQEYPEVESSPYKTEQLSFDVAFTHDEANNANRFEAMLGLPVICKTPYGDTIVGIITAWDRQNICFYKSYTAIIQRIQWRGFINEDG